MHQRGESTDQKSRCPHITLRFEEAPLMRLSVETLRQVVKRDLAIAFVPQQLTSYGGLELLRRYVRRLELPRRLQAPRSAVTTAVRRSPCCSLRSRMSAPGGWSTCSIWSATRSCRGSAGVPASR